MKPQVIKIIFNLSLALAFVTAALLITGNSFGFRDEMRFTLYLSGGMGIVLQLYYSLFVEKNKQFNLLFWLGTVVIFLAVIMKTLNFSYYQVALLVGAGVTGISYFYNPFDNSDSEDEEKDKLLDS